MAKTFYKYAERDAENRIDWSEVAKNMNDVLSAELKERRQKKRKIEEAQEESLKYVENAPQGQHVGKDEFVLDYAEKVMETMRIQNQLLKEGKLSLKDYNIQRANIMNGTKEFYEVSENWNTTYAEAKKMLDEGNLSEFSQSILMDVEKMGNFTNHSLYINPIDGQVSIGERQLTNPDEPYDPETNPYTTVVVPNENSLRPLQELNNRQDQLLAPFDLEGSLDESANMLADTYEMLLQEDPTQSVNDIRENENYSEAETTIINAQVGDNNSFNAVSILTDIQTEVLDGYDNAGEEFDFTNDPNDPRLTNADGSRNQSMILRVQDPNQPNSGRLVPQLTDEQLEMAREITKKRLDVMVNRSVTRKTEWAPSQWEYLANEKSEQEQVLLTNLIDLFSGDEADMESTMAGLMDLPGNEWIQTIERNNEEIVINRGMANQEIIPLYTAGVIDGIPGGEEWTEEQFLKAVASKLGGFDNYAMAMEVFKKLKGGDDYVASKLTTDITEPIIYTKKTDPPRDGALRVDPLMEIDEPGITAAFQDLFDDPDFTKPTIGQTFAYLDEFYDDEIKNWTDYVPAVTSLVTEVLQKSLRNNDVGIRPQDIQIRSTEDGSDSFIVIEIKGRNQPPTLIRLKEDSSRGTRLLNWLTDYVDGLLLKRSDLLPPEEDSRIEDNAPQ